MGIIINNSSFRLRNSTFSQSPPIPPIGQYFRIVNLNPAFTGIGITYPYTKIDGSPGSISVGADSFSYFQALLGTQYDYYDDIAKYAITNLIVTSTTFEEFPVFTEELLDIVGAGSWIKSVDITEVIIECWGGGGAGGGVTQINSSGGGGAAGQYVRKYVQYASPQQGISYTIGAGGVGTTGNGNNGQDTTWATNIAIAKGGAFGSTSTTELPSGDAGLGSLIGAVGDVIYKGGDGGFGQYFARSGGAYGGGGGGGAGSTGTGKTELFNGKIGGALTPEYGGEGATGPELNTAGATGVPGFIYAAGGSGAAKISGATNYLGGAGAQGLIRLIYR